MARGPKPKSLALRLVDGSFRPSRHGDRNKVGAQVERDARAFGPLEKPKHLRGQAKAAWEKWIAPATWLDGSRGAAAEAFCLLWQEYSEAPRMFPAAKHGQMRGLLSDLGLTDERKRGGSEPPKDEFCDECD